MRQQRDSLLQTDAHSTKLTNGPNKLERLPLTSLSSLVLSNTPGYRAHSQFTKKIKCFEHCPIL